MPNSNSRRRASSNLKTCAGSKYLREITAFFRKVAMMIGMVADGMTPSEILAAYPDLEDEDIRAALQYAAETVRERDLPADDEQFVQAWVQAAGLGPPQLTFALVLLIG
jgi:anti-sigma factor RsiW